MSPLPIKYSAQMFAGLLVAIFLTLNAQLAFAALDDYCYNEPFTEDSTLKTYVEYSLAHNPKIKAYLDKYQATLEEIPQAGSLPDPNFKYTHLIEAIQTRTGPQRNQFFISQKFPWIGTLQSQTRLAEQLAESKWAEYGAQYLDTIEAVGVAFYDYAYLNKATEITNQNITLLKKLEAIIGEKVKAGGDYQQLLKIQVELEKGEDSLNTLVRERHRQTAKLSALLNRNNNQLLPWPILMEPTHFKTIECDLIDTLRESNPAIKMLEHQNLAQEYKIKLAKLKQLPDVTIGFNYFETGQAISPNTPGSGKDPYGVTFSINIPIWFSKNMALTREARADKRAVNYMLCEKINELESRLTSSMEHYNESLERIKLYKSSLLPKARHALAIMEDSYIAGRSEILDLIDSQRILLELELVFWRAIADAKKAEISIQTLLGSVEL